MSEKIDYSKGVYDAKKLGTGRMLFWVCSICLPCLAQRFWCRCSPA